MNNSLPQQYAYRRPEDDKSEILALVRGDTLIGLHGDRWSFAGVTRPAYGNSSGRVQAFRLCPDAYVVSDMARAYDCPHMWHRDGIEEREFFPSVFDLYLGDVHGNEV